MKVFKVVVGDTPQLVLSVAQHYEPVDLSDPGLSILFKVRKVGETDLAASVPCTKLAGIEAPGGVIDPSPPYEDAGTGGLLAAVCPNTTFTDPGRYEGEIEVTDETHGLVNTVYRVVQFQARQQF